MKLKTFRFSRTLTLCAVLITAFALFAGCSGPGVKPSPNPSPKGSPAAGPVVSPASSPVSSARATPLFSPAVTALKPSPAPKKAIVLSAGEKGFNFVYRGHIIKGGSIEEGGKKFIRAEVLEQVMKKLHRRPTLDADSMLLVLKYVRLRNKKVFDKSWKGFKLVAGGEIYNLEGVKKNGNAYVSLDSIDTLLKSMGYKLKIEADSNLAVVARKRIKRRHPKRSKEYWKKLREKRRKMREKRKKMLEKQRKDKAKRRSGGSPAPINVIPAGP